MGVHYSHDGLQVRRIFEAFHEPFKRRPRELAIAQASHGPPVNYSSTSRNRASHEESNPRGLNAGMDGKNDHVVPRGELSGGCGPSRREDDKSGAPGQSEPLLLLPPGGRLLSDGVERQQSSTTHDMVRNRQNVGGTLGKEGQEEGEECIDLTTEDSEAI